jgi:hypothetical protein
LRLEEKAKPNSEGADKNHEIKAELNLEFSTRRSAIGKFKELASMTAHRA